MESYLKQMFRFWNQQVVLFECRFGISILFAPSCAWKTSATWRARRGLVVLELDVLWILNMLQLAQKGSERHLLGNQGGRVIGSHGQVEFHKKGHAAARTKSPAHLKMLGSDVKLTLWKAWLGKLVFRVQFSNCSDAANSLHCRGNGRRSWNVWRRLLHG